MDTLDYIFYRVFKFYQKWDNTPQIYASGVLTVMEFFVLLSGLAFLRLFIEFPIPQKYLVIPIIVLLIGINWWKYERNLDFKRFEERWGNEDLNKRKLRGWIITISLTLSISFPILIGVLKNNLGII
jgi:hypothetical protein